jgi:hypothetical protein
MTGAAKWILPPWATVARMNPRLPKILATSLGYNMKAEGGESAHIQPFGGAPPPNAPDSPIRSSLSCFVLRSYVAAL